MPRLAMAAVVAWGTEACLGHNLNCSASNKGAAHGPGGLPPQLQWQGFCGGGLGGVTVAR
eukprot:8929528-Alexandrium_andersonii.AAC.1